MKKAKGQTIDLLYSKKEETGKTKKKSTTNLQKKNTKKKNQSNKKEIINLENEIIIGLTPKKEEIKKKENKISTKKSSKKNQNKKIKNKSNTKSSSKGKNKTIHKNKNEKKLTKSKKSKIMKLLCTIVLIIIAIIIFMRSNLFNIKQIIISNNNKISSDEIISLSGLKIDMNMFKISSSSINNNIKVNPYIENVKVKRGLNGIITLEVQERIPTYILQFGNSYVYINNQGYMLEISEQPLNLPIITGFETKIEDIKEGNRLVVNDLKRLEDIIKITESAKNNSLGNIISSIDIAEKNNYKIIISSEGKIVQFGEATNINIKLLKIEEIIKQEKGISGEIYFQDSEKTVFRELVSF